VEKAEWTRAVIEAGPSLLQIARQIVGDESSAEDVVAETFLRAWQKRGQLRRRRKLHPWLKRICRNCALDMVRRRTSDPLLLPHAELIESVNDAEAAADRPGHQRLLERLPDTLKSVARMRFVDGMGYSEIAQIERLSTSTVRGRIYMAREALRREIEMTAEQSEPKSDEWDDGQLTPSPDRVVRWRGMRLRLLGTWRPGQKGFYGPSGRRLSRVPKAVGRSHVFGHWDQHKRLNPAQNALIFFHRTGAPGYAFVQGCQTTTDRNVVIWSLLYDSDAVDGRRRISTILIGAAVEDEEAAVRFRSDFSDECSNSAFPGWGAAFVSRAQPGDDAKTCRLTLAYSSATAKTDWAVRGLVDDDSEVTPTSTAQGASCCAEGDITGLTLTLPISPAELRGIVFRPRWHVKVDWGTISMPPAAAPAGA